jgi:VIT1/CCC1 family predicted Fe2+/Mn2+ transporter
MCRYLCAVACGEYISVSSQRDTEEADVEKEREEQRKGPAARAHELEELTQIYCNRCVDRNRISCVPTHYV